MGFLFANDEFTTVDVPGAIRTNAWKIDPQRRIVGGYTGADGRNRIFILAEDGFTTIVLPSTMGIPLENGGINASGDIASPYCDTAPCATTGHGFVDVPGAISTGVFAINARGDVVGFYDDASGKRHGCGFDACHRTVSKSKEQHCSRPRCEFWIPIKLMTGSAPPQYDPTACGG